MSIRLALMTAHNVVIYYVSSHNNYIRLNFIPNLAKEVYIAF